MSFLLKHGGWFLMLIGVVGFFVVTRFGTPYYVTFPGTQAVHKQGFASATLQINFVIASIVVAFLGASWVLVQILNFALRRFSMK